MRTQKHRLIAPIARHSLQSPGAELLKCEKQTHFRGNRTSGQELVFNECFLQHVFYRVIHSYFIDTHPNLSTVSAPIKGAPTIQKFLF